ncbi:MAG: DUF4126 domain-containing protein, partial [Terrabacter sp.]
PASNIVVSTTEDVTVTGVTALAIAHPWWAAAIAFLLLALGAFLVYKLSGRIRRYKRRYDAWGERVGIAQPSGRAVDTTADPAADPDPDPGRRRGWGLGRATDPRRKRPDRPLDRPLDSPFDQET